MVTSFRTFLPCLPLIAVGALSAQTLYVPGGTSTGIGDNTANSNVGIGTSSPGAKLEVAGTIKTTDTTDSSSTTTGALVTAGGLGVAKSLYSGGKISQSWTPGTFPAGIANGVELHSVGSADSGGTTDFRGLSVQTVIAGSNSAASLYASASIPSLNGTSGTVSNVFGHRAYLSMGNGMNLMNYRAFATGGYISGSGNITSSFFYYDASPPTFISTGDITGIISGLYVGNIGRLAATTIAGVDVLDQTKGSGNAYAYRGRMAAASGKYNLYLDGTAQSYFAGNIGIGTATPGKVLDISIPSGGNSIRLVSSAVTTDFGISSSNGFGFVYTRTASPLIFGTNDAERIRIGSDGNVGIGTSSPSYKLAVNGTVRAKEVIVDTGWSDYVFADDYRLAPLSEVEQHIKAEKHLPGIPSATEVGKGGVSIGEMQAKLLAKIEELTLHVIEQEKDLHEQAIRIERLERENATLRSR